MTYQANDEKGKGIWRPQQACALAKVELVYIRHNNLSQMTFFILLRIFINISCGCWGQQ
uniref:Uncharacterized protein n=1 Tax=Rhizophora mucronata TaxID=61149 RepID=A0A2P2PIT7_RHIMU